MRPIRNRFLIFFVELLEILLSSTVIIKHKGTLLKGLKSRCNKQPIMPDLYLYIMCTPTNLLCTRVTSRQHVWPVKTVRFFSLYLICYSGIRYFGNFRLRR
jgi:hypothetical protein